MKKLYTIIVLLVFVNFLAMPIIAMVMGFDIPQTNIIITEEENHTTSISIFEKTIPNTLSVSDYLNFFENKIQLKIFSIGDDSIHLSPYISIFSPPPELFTI